MQRDGQDDSKEDEERDRKNNNLDIRLNHETFEEVLGPSVNDWLDIKVDDVARVAVRFSGNVLAGIVASLIVMSLYSENASPSDKAGLITYAKPAQGREISRGSRIGH